MHKTLNSKITPFGGIHLLHKKIFSEGIAQFIDNELGNRCSNLGYNYSDLILSRIYTTFCGGHATEDVNYIRENTLQYLKGLKVPSADTILRGDVELSVPCGFFSSDSGVSNKVNINDKMNQFLIKSAIKLGQLDPKDKELTYDFDHQFIPAEKHDAEYSYKNAKGYFPGVATISNIPVYIEGRNGNCSVKSEQLSTHKRIFSALSQQGVKPKYARMDSGSYLKEVTDFFHEQNILFFIRANNSEALLTAAVDAENWKNCMINHQDLELASFPYKFGKYTHRIIAYRMPNKTGQLSALTNDAKTYLFIITNDKEISEKDAIQFYNKRGESERVFDIQNNDFSWDSMPHSFLEENTVFLIIMAVAHIIYKWLLGIFSVAVEGLTNSSRLKKFIFRLVAMAAKITKSGRRQIIHLVTKNNVLIKLANTS